MRARVRYRNIRTLHVRNIQGKASYATSSHIFAESGWGLTEEESDSSAYGKEERKRSKKGNVG
jgi:hypothetical protein